MIKKFNHFNSLKLFFLIAAVSVTCLFSSMNAQAQVFPVYPYFSPLTFFNPLSGGIFPVPVPTVFPFSLSLPTSTLPTASIQGTTIYIPTSITAFSINIPGLGPQLTNILPPATIFIYPSGYTPPAPLVPVVPTVAVLPPPPTVVPPPPPTIIAPTVVAPTVVPTVIAPTVVPTVIAPTVVPPTTSAISAAVSGLLLPFSFPSYTFPYFPINPLIWW